VIDRGGGISIGGGLFWCGLVYEKAIGTDVFQASSSDFSTGPGPNAQDINFTGLSGGDYYYGVCTIPKKVSGFSQVIRWQLTEN
jgi:hypothetical protein